MSTRRVHLIVGILGVIAFVMTGQLLARHHPPTPTLPGELRMMYVSRHIYLLAGALVNLVLGLYLQRQSALWRRVFQGIGSLSILLSPFLLSMAFLSEPTLGVSGRSWRSYFGLISLFLGVVIHLVANLGADETDLPNSSGSGFESSES